jgi:methionyl-tRNA synthetase
MLKGRKLYLPDNVPANEFLNLEGNYQRLKNWAVWLHEYLEEFPNQQDVLRYALTSNAQKQRIMISLGKIFKRETTIVAIYGNFINRVVVLTNKYYNGIVPQPNELGSG